MNQELIEFANDAGLYAKLRYSESPRESYMEARQLQEAMKSRYPKNACDKFFNHFGGEIGQQIGGI